ncbi:hypothetical protein [Cellulosimicrobium sp. SL-1]|uniref:hypothetical protein n=1 Tax=Cellulosimicrobium sp. SL-1 TaxID=2699423 RepID=UPI0013D3FCA4|nr:hypothetical protein [Cellulosimicrobium sp. SL-1]
MTVLTDRPTDNASGWLRLADDLHRRTSPRDPAGVRTRVTPDLDVERAVARLAAAWVATDDPDFREMGRSTGRAHLAAVIDDELENLRMLLAFDTARASLTVADIAEETRVYLSAALTPNLTADGVHLYALWVLASAANAPLPKFDHAAALATAALRGWAERTRLAGGAR